MSGKTTAAKSTAKPTARATRRKQPALVPLGPETLGHKLRRAYKLGQERRPGLTYRTTAELIRPFTAISDASLVRWEKDLQSIDSTPRSTLLKIYFALLVYGVDPADLGITPELINLDPGIAKRAVDVLTPTSGCLTERAA